jgi:hypothetical protein
MVNTVSLDIQPLHEVDGNWVGNTIGYFCNGHFDKQQFFEQAIAEWRFIQTEIVSNAHIGTTAHCTSVVRPNIYQMVVALELPL